MIAWKMTADSALEFYRRCIVQNVKDGDELARMKILAQMAKEGLISGITVTKRSKEQYVADQAKNGRVLHIKKREDVNPEERVDAVWTRDSETGDHVLIDRLTSKVLVRHTFHPEDTDTTVWQLLKERKGSLVIFTAAAAYLLLVGWLL